MPAEPAGHVPLFADFGHTVSAFDARLTQLLASDGQTRVEITFDAHGPEGRNDLYVNLCNANRDYLIHLSIRLVSGKIVLNDLKDGQWGAEVAASLDFGLLRYWRLWLTIDATGSFSVRLGPFTLATRCCALTPESFVSIESNVTVRPAFPVAAQPGDVSAIVNLTDTSRSPMLLCIADDAGIGPKALRTARGPLSDIRKITIAGRRWWHCLADFGQGEAAVLHGKQGNWPVLDVVGEPVVEIDAATISFRSQQLFPDDSVRWSSGRSGETAVAHPPRRADTAPDARGLVFHYHTTPLSQLVDIADVDGVAADFSLEAPGLNAASCTLTINPDRLGGLTSNLVTHPCAFQALRRLAELRRASLSDRAGNDAHLSPDVYFSWDAADGTVEIDYTSTPGTLLRADIRVTGQPSRLSLNVGLGSGVFAVGDTLGLVADVAVVGPRGGGNPGAIVPTIRSVGEGERGDTLLADTLLAGPTPQVAVLLHAVAPEDPLTWRQDDHTLVLPLPPRSLTLDLRDMRLFVLPKST